MLLVANDKYLIHIYRYRPIYEKLGAKLLYPRGPLSEFASGILLFIKALC